MAITVCPKRMTINRLAFSCNAQDIFLLELIKVSIQFGDVVCEFQIGIQHNYAPDIWKNSMHCNGHKEQRIAVVGTRFVTELFLHWADYCLQIQSQLFDIKRLQLQPKSTDLLYYRSC